MHTFRNIASICLLLICSHAVHAASGPKSAPENEQDATSSKQPTFLEMQKKIQQERAIKVHNEKVTEYCESLSLQANGTFKERFEGVPESAAERDRIKSLYGKSGEDVYNRIYGFEIPKDFKPVLADTTREAFAARLKSDCLRTNLKKIDRPKKKIECSKFYEDKIDFCARKHTGEMLERCKKWAIDQYKEAGCQ